MGGLIIGAASSLLFMGAGKIAGISGVFAQLISKPAKSDVWKYFFLGGLVLGSLLYSSQFPESFNFALKNSRLEIIIAGLFVGFGTRLGSGCTSGHGVCGISRFSKRSIVATATFISVGILTVLLKRVLL
jgi:hypothetical protein